MKRHEHVSNAHYAGGRLLRVDGSRLVPSVSSDSRTVQPGDVFVALIGDKFDGHQYVRKVAEAGAAAVIVSHVSEDWEDLSVAVIQVTDTLDGLQKLAANYRAWHNPFVVGITGSNGKTSTKDLTSHVLAARYQVCATEGNLNNHNSLPLRIHKKQAGNTCSVNEKNI